MPVPYPTTPTPITLADNKERHLRYSLGAVKRIKEKWGKNFTDIMGHPPEEFLPPVLMEGLIEKEGLTEEVILNDLITGPMLEYVQLCFVEAFFGQQSKRAIMALLEKNQSALAKATAPEAVAPEPESKPTVM